ncbi:MAG: tRNA (adenosine(37)-N6)-threonylcarbamoyltransferase complex dimerization subunit type 1 TsaB [Candidatus Omnitrophica bacterium]|nr:tRNA (adenosine(37)-N6)-threonylcarbamoyltransferase complex dimerization subunit type 1 TsaB [Candidatus Omnitrophota bacterium]
MKLIGIDTSSKVLAVGLYDGKKIYSYHLEVGRLLSSVITVTIERLARALGWDIADVNCFACGLGPGSFTGLRIGLATIKGLAWALQKPVIGISSLDILALNALGINGYVAPFIDAKRNLVYTSLYQVRHHVCKRVRPYQLVDSAQACKSIKSNAYILGDAIPIYRDMLAQHLPGAILMDKDSWYPKGHAIIQLALERIKQASYANAFKLEPMYLYPKECQIRKSSK